MIFLLFLIAIFLSCASSAQKNVIKKRIEQTTIRHGHYSNTLITQKTVKRDKNNPDA